MKIRSYIFATALFCAVVLFTLTMYFFASKAAAAPDRTNPRPPDLITTNVTTKVQPVLFVPNNLTADPAYLPVIDSAMEELSSWYGAQLGGKTFNYVSAVQVIGQYELRHYCPKTITDTQCIQVPGQTGADPGDIYNVLDDYRYSRVLSTPQHDSFDLLGWRIRIRSW